MRKDKSNCATDAFTLFAEDPTKKQAAAIKKKIKQLARQQMITPDDAKGMILDDYRIGRAYGLPKRHKPDVPLRIIVPFIESPTYNMAKWLCRDLKHLTHGSEYSINNSQLSFPRMHDRRPKIWLRYVDDTFVTINNNDAKMVHQRLNEVFRAIQSTHVGAVGDSLPFLDVRIQKLSDGSLAKNVYRKGSNADIILNYGNNDLAVPKRSCVQTLFHRTYRNCNGDDLFNDELAYLYQLFQSDGYSMSFVKNCLSVKHN
ncbi:unnamed protein product [Dibothriocephalus latus]|uniref:Helix-turn-helix domain-containing protein n=1 Tax=Dibothriocephalus latus TaxID=60516 RepID=A0A3P7LFB9_DIBLA|nr:unnamed protein product [Dibothriocephalus latus]